MQKTGARSALTAIAPKDRLPRMRIPRGRRFPFDRLTDGVTDGLTDGLTKSARALR